MPAQQFSLKALAATLFTTSVSAHMLMSAPIPYGKSTLNNSPLAADGSDFPCKQRTGVYDLEGASNTMAVGSTQPLTFVGTAVHGGGSCQVSLTTDLQPTADTKWMVIKSIEGGCPADVPGNLDVGGATTPDPYTFNYTIPEGIAPGDYTIAWSWINKVGNREFYMNCGPATITAPTKKRYAPNAPTSKNTKRQATFPDMFLANLGSISNGCTTVEEFDYVYPDPGSDVQKLATGTFDANAQFVNPAVCGGSSNAAASSPSATAAASGASSAAASSVSGGIFATGAASISPAPAAATETVSPVPAAPSSPASIASAAPAAASSSPSSSSTTSGAVVAGAACTPEGEWACAADGNSYQRCASGVWSVSMQMAAGTSCTPGVSDTLTENVTNTKRRSFHARRSHQAYARLPQRAGL